MSNPTATSTPLAGHSLGVRCSPNESLDSVDIDTEVSIDKTNKGLSIFNNTTATGSFSGFDPFVLLSPLSIERIQNLDPVLLPPITPLRKSQSIKELQSPPILDSEFDIPSDFFSKHDRHKDKETVKTADSTSQDDGPTAIQHAVIPDVIHLEDSASLPSLDEDTLSRMIDAEETADQELLQAQKDDICYIEEHIPITHKSVMDPFDLQHLRHLLSGNPTKQHKTHTQEIDQIAQFQLLSKETQTNFEAEYSTSEQQRSTMLIVQSLLPHIYSIVEENIQSLIASSISTVQEKIERIIQAQLINLQLSSPQEVLTQENSFPSEVEIVEEYMSPPPTIPNTPTDEPSTNSNPYRLKNQQKHNLKRKDNFTSRFTGTIFTPTEQPSSRDSQVSIDIPEETAQETDSRTLKETETSQQQSSTLDKRSKKIKRKQMKRADNHPTQGNVDHDYQQSRNLTWTHQESEDSTQVPSTPKSKGTTHSERIINENSEVGTEFPESTPEHSTRRERKQEQHSHRETCLNNQRRQDLTRRRGFKVAVPDKRLPKQMVKNPPKIDRTTKPSHFIPLRKNRQTREKQGASSKADHGHNSQNAWEGGNPFRSDRSKVPDRSTDTLPSSASANPLQGRVLSHNDIKRASRTILIWPTDEAFTGDEINNEIKKLHLQIPKDLIYKITKNVNNVQVDCRFNEHLASLTELLLQNSLFSSNAYITQIQVPMQLMVLYSVPQTYSAIDIRNSIMTSLSLSKTDVNIKRSLQGEGNLINWVFSAPKNKVQGHSQFKVLIGRSHCQILQYKRLQRCFNCQSYSHVAKECDFQSLCANCGQLHHSSVCPATSFHCINCEIYNRCHHTEFDTKHATYFSTCPTYLQELLVSLEGSVSNKSKARRR